jgi:hypothetical protein
MSPTLARAAERARRTELSENTAAGTGADPGAVDRQSGDGDAVLLFVGGPLDGRVEIRSAELGAPLPTITHIHLHDGPKVVHRYDLEPLTDEAAVYTVRPRARKNARDGSVAD